MALEKRVSGKVERMKRWRDESIKITDFHWLTDFYHGKSHQSCLVYRFLRQSPKQRGRRYMDKELLAVSNLQYKSAHRIFLRFVARTDPRMNLLGVRVLGGLKWWFDELSDTSTSPSLSVICKVEKHDSNRPDWNMIPLNALSSARLFHSWWRQHSKKTSIE